MKIRINTAYLLSEKKIPTLFFPTVFLKLLIINLALFHLIFITTGRLWAGCGSPPDPRYDSSGYARWCKCQGGTVDYSSGVGCNAPRGNTSYPQSWEGFMLKEFQKGLQQGKENQRRRLHEQKLENQRYEKRVKATSDEFRVSAQRRGPL